MAALMIIPIMGLTLFLQMAKNIFEKDKVAYVYDASLAVSKTTAARVNSEIASKISVAQAIVLNYRADSKNLAESGTYFFDREAKFEAFQIFAWNPSSSSYDRNVDIAKPTGKRLLEGRQNLVDALVTELKKKPIVLHSIEGSNDRMLLGARFGAIDDPRHVMAVAVFDASDLANVFRANSNQLLYLSMKDNGRVILGGYNSPETFDPVDIWSGLAKKGTPEGIEELAVGSKTRYLASFSDVGAADLVVISMVDRAAATAAVRILLKKAGLFSILIIAATMLIAVLVSRGLTFALARLSDAAQRISAGDFAVRVDMKSGGEIGQLSSSFNSMAGEISRLMQETAEKARMASELETARTVQETLFPESVKTIGPFEIAGHYSPASECGGDWWFYFENGEKLYVMIGDATGHGASAALLTSAARAVVSVLTSGPALPVGQCMSILNRAIHDTSKGRILMTFFIACIDRKTGEVTYSNASHEPPFLLHKMDHEPDRKSFEPVIDNINPRLGENPLQMYNEGQLQLIAGDTLIFYTDGVIDLKNREEKELGERKFLKILGSGLHHGANLAQSLSSVVRDFEEFRSEQPLIDDVTMILFRYSGQPSDSPVEGSRGVA
jgi:phosphoserine phosphatase RsbU/P